MLFIVLNVDYISRKPGIEVGETTPGGKFTLLTVECLGSCGAAPMMQVNETYYENLTEAKIDRILAELELGTGDCWKNRGLTTS